ncbi:MAG TPA: Stk1 family PASTA domain-containing Ser/Thr kinase [Clostridiales bacterium]|nr:Stk1 family PASTA domain-containing Ser/Thr kinase [Clostridiales bacterium]
MEGQILGNRYKLLERIGGGGMAVVYKAKCLLLNRFVAVKILRSEFTDDEEFVKRFRVEAQAAASLNHPNIVSIYDVGKQDDIQYIVMELIDGITLKEYISRKGALPWKEAIGIAIQICSALEHAHRNYIVHRDIKPHNIMITKDGIAKVTDFGIARAVTSATITMVGSTIGSVHYFSPEQARGGFIDEKSDLYSLGITIYEMVTGKVPFDGESPVAIALKHIQEKPEKPIDINPKIPKGVNDLIIKAMKKDQNLRYQTASEMLADLQKVLADPDVKINGSNAVEELPTKKMQAVGAGIDIIEENTDDGDGEYMEEDETATRKKKDWLSICLGIASGLVIMALIAYLGVKLVIPMITADDTASFVVEDYTNREFDEVKELLSRYDITAVDERVFNETVRKGVIISQDIAVGNTLKPGSTISFTVSDGPRMVEIPDIRGQEQRIAEVEMTNAGLMPEIVKEYSDTVGKDLVIRTEPEAFELVRPDTVVKIFVSAGPKLEKVIMPDLIGMTRAEAENAILMNNLTIGKLLPEGIVSDVAKVIKQYPLPNQEIDEYTAVDLTFGIDEPSDNETGGSLPSDPGGNVPSVPGNGGSQQTGPVKTKAITISLNPGRTYDEEVLVYVESTPSDTNVRRIEMNQYVRRDMFPISLPITLGETGTTHVIVYLDNELALETDIPNQ